LLISFGSSEKFRFDNYALYKILPENGEQIKILEDKMSDLRYDFWSVPSAALDYVSVMSSPQHKNELEEFLHHHQIKYNIKINNIQEHLDKETVRTYRSNSSVSMEWDSYYKLADINTWLDDLVATYKGIASIIVGGRSYEGRQIRGIKISHGSGKRAIYVEGTLHGVEWITTTTVCYIINELLTSNDTDTKAAARDFDWYIFPVANPDGYVFSHEQNRMWRKNRRPTTGGHIGVDLNRNWNNNWLVIGASTDPANNRYAGLGPFSEPESRSLSTYIKSIGDKIELFLTFHSFGQLLMVPFGNSTAPYANYHDAINIGRRAMGALSVRYGTQYFTGNIAEAIYLASGGETDWVKERIGVPLVYCYELRDKGDKGFLLPEDQILPNNQEVMDSVVELIHQAKRFGYLRDKRNSDLKYDFWREPSAALEYVSVMSSPQHKNELEEFLNHHQIKYDIKINNIQEHLDKETVRTYRSNNSVSMEWDSYYKLADIYAWLDDLVATYKGIASIIVGGRSHEGRQIRGIKISHGSGRRAIFVEGTMHAREWITTTAVCYILNELLTSNDSETKAAAHDYDWYIFPVTNPDGYVWSHEQNRMWRKNRRPTTGGHIGVDLNRNWNSNWLVSGASTNPASDTFAGLGPFSEPESRSLSAYISSIGNKIELFLSFHSFGQLLLVPFGNSTAPYANYHDAINIGRRAMGALSVRYGTQYVTGNIAEAIYSATGGGIDWVKEKVGVPLVYCYELRDKNEHGFLLPEDQILPNNQEVMDSVVEMIHQAKRFGYMGGGAVFTAV
ncbi:zinc carboxypeptidase A 1-like, partial [Bicyclus anynana]|uniref:Zinc carboxypeptidase A 1-like n=1 Tax=Bicyclus anynana TaxID=110368 RepID=A0A6J1P2K4_BICAN